MGRWQPEPGRLQRVLLATGGLFQPASLAALASASGQLCSTVSPLPSRCLRAGGGARLASSPRPPSPVELALASARLSGQEPRVRGGSSVSTAGSSFPSSMAKVFAELTLWLRKSGKQGLSRVLARTPGPCCPTPLHPATSTWTGGVEAEAFADRRSFSLVTHVTLARASSCVMRLQPGRGRWDLDCGHVPYWPLIVLSRALLLGPLVAWGSARKDGRVSGWGCTLERWSAHCGPLHCVCE